MKVLVTGRAILTQPDRCTGQQLAAGFQQAGHECVFYGNFYGKPFQWLGVEEATTEEFDLVVVTEMNDGYPGYEGLFDHLSLKGVPRLYWDFDISYHPEVSYGWATKVDYDGYLVGNKYYCGKDAFGRFGKPVLHLPYACSPQIHRKMEGVEKSYHLGFIGSMTEERKRLIELAKNGASRRGSIHSAEGVFGDDLIRQTNQYYVMFHNNQDACKGLVPGRPWETAGCGTTLLMDRTSYEDFIEFLPATLHEDVFVYDNDTDILAWLSCHATWGQNGVMLDIAGDALMNYVHANHSYKNRAERIVEWIKEQKIATKH
jgi:hypothetical protein